MMTQILTILIVAAVLAGSAAAALQTTDVSLASARASARIESATSGGTLVFAVVPPAGRFAASASGFTQAARRIVVLTPQSPSAAD
jgi:hypothetical protein